MLEEKLSVKSKELGMDLSIPDTAQECVVKITDIHWNILKFAGVGYWHIGRIISALVDKGEQKVIATIAETLNKSERTVQYWHAFYKTFSKEDDLRKILKASEYGFEWTDLRQLTHKSEEEGTEILDEMASGDLTREEYKNSTPAIEGELIDTESEGKSEEESIHPSEEHQLGDEQKNMKNIFRQIVRLSNEATTIATSIKSSAIHIPEYLAGIKDDLDNKDLLTYLQEHDVYKALNNISSRLNDICVNSFNTKDILDNFIDEADEGGE